MIRLSAPTLSPDGGSYLPLPELKRVALWSRYKTDETSVILGRAQLCNSLNVTLVITYKVDFVRQLRHGRDAEIRWESLDHHLDVCHGPVYFVYIVNVISLPVSLPT